MGDDTARGACRSKTEKTLLKVLRLSFWCSLLIIQITINPTKPTPHPLIGTGTMPEAQPPPFDELEWFWDREDDKDGFNWNPPQRFYMTDEYDESADWRVRVRGDFVLPVHSQVLALASSVMRDLLNSKADAFEPILW